MNFLLSVMTVSICTAMGFYFSRRLRLREEQLCEALLLIKELIVQIRYTNAKIGDILKNSAENAAYQNLYFVTDCFLLKENEDFHEIWSEGVKKQIFLNQRDKELLLALGEHLGETDSEGQLSFLELTEAMLVEQREEAREERGAKGRMYRSVGLLCGLAAGILVL